jgi:hypothetical protein
MEPNMRDSRRIISEEISSEINISHGRKHLKSGLRPNRNYFIPMKQEMCGILEQMHRKSGPLLKK